MVTEQFRRQLRQEAEQWWKEGLIDAHLYEQLAERYQLQTLEREASHRFISILMGLGSILLGLAAITFVAANWQVWSRPVKLGLLLCLFISVNAAGFYLWRRPTALKGQQRLGHGLLLLGALLLGANLALLSQMFHQSGNTYELLLIWGLGVIVMAYSLRLISLGILAWILISSGYWLGLLTYFTREEATLSQLLVQHMPLVAAGLFTGLAYRCRSKLLFGLGSILVAIALCCNCIAATNVLPLPAGWVAATAFALPSAFLWSYSSRIWRSSRTADPFQTVARSLALCGLGFTFYLLSFRFWWSDATPNYGSSWDWQPLVDVVILFTVTGLGWLQLRHDWRGWRQERALHSGTVALSILVIALSLIWHYDVHPLGNIGVVLFNLMLFLLAVGLIRDGLALGERITLWGGMSLLVFGIITRMLEYETGLLLKSIVFAGCGISVIVAGLWFERNIKPETQLSSSQEHFS